MKPYKMLSNHRPHDGEYGDCLRTCIASLLEIPPAKVPHFVADGADASIVWDRVSTYLHENGLGIFRTGFDGGLDLYDLLDALAIINPNVYYMVMGRGFGGNHIVICKNNEVVHDPAPMSPGLLGPLEADHEKLWVVVVLISARMIDA